MLPKEAVLWANACQEPKVSAKVPLQQLLKTSLSSYKTERSRKLSRNRTSLSVMVITILLKERPKLVLQMHPWRRVKLGGGSLTHQRVILSVTHLRIQHRI